MAKTGLLLPGGSCRCAFQVGALQALEEAGMRFEIALGVSSGAWNAAAYALDALDRLPELWARVLSESLISRTRSQWRTNLSFWNFRWIHQNVSRHLIDWSQLSKAETEVVIALTRLPSFRRELISSRTHPGVDFFKATLASNTLWPFYTLPTRVGNRFYLDGGFADNAPYDHLLNENCERVIAIVTSPHERLDRKPMRPWGYVEPFERLQIIAPRQPLPIDFNDFDQKKLEQTIRLGYQAGCDFCASALK